VILNDTLHPLEDMDGARTSRADDMSHSNAGILHLPSARLAAQMGGYFVDIGEACRA